VPAVTGPRRVELLLWALHQEIRLKTSVSLLALLLLCLPATAHADERSEALQHYEKGRRAFDLGAYEEAAAEYASAYRIRDDPALLYNLGQAQRLANHPVEALRSYRMFLIRVPDAANRDEVERKIAELQKLSAQPKATPTPPSSGAAKAPVAASSTPSLALTPPRPADNRQSARAKTTAGGVLVGAGAAIAVGGVVCGVLAKRNSDSLSQLDRNMQPFNSSQERAGKTEQILEGVLSGVGAAAVVVGGALLIVGRREQRRLAIAPSAGRGLVGAVVAGSF
jgi:hypothetical protein